MSNYNDREGINILGVVILIILAIAVISFMVRSAHAAEPNYEFMEITGRITCVETAAARQMYDDNHYVEVMRGTSFKTDRIVSVHMSSNGELSIAETMDVDGKLFTCVYANAHSVKRMIDTALPKP